MTRYLDPLLAATAIALISGCGGSGSNIEVVPPVAKPLSVPTVPIQGFSDYTVKVWRADGTRVCSVRFRSLPPTSKIAAEVVQKAAESLVEHDSNQSILAMGVFDENGVEMPDIYYGGPLVYKPSEPRIRTLAEQSGDKIEECDRGSYFIQTIHHTRGDGSQYYHVNFAFPDHPTSRDVKAAVLPEFKTLRASGIDIHSRVYVGDKANKITWKHIQAPNGKYMNIDYDAESLEVTPNFNW